MKAKRKENGKVTNEQLAVMVQKGFSGMGSKITEANDTLAIMVQNSFLDMEEKFTRKFDAVDLRFNSVDRELKGIRNTLTYKADKDKVEILERRVGKVESALATRSGK